MGINKQIKKTPSFTLVETIIVISVVSLVLPALFAIVFVILRQQTRLFKLQKMKQEGDLIVNTIQSYIKNNAVGIYTDSNLTTEVCDKAMTTQSYSSSDGDDFFFKDKSGNWFNYYLSDDKIVFRDGLISRQLTSSLTCIDDFYISCWRKNSFSSPVINLNFKVYYLLCEEENEPDFVNPLNYFITVKLKNQ